MTTPTVYRTPVGTNHPPRPRPGLNSARYTERTPVARSKLVIVCGLPHHTAPSGVFPMGPPQCGRFGYPHSPLPNQSTTPLSYDFQDARSPPTPRSLIFLSQRPQSALESFVSLPGSSRRANFHERFTATSFVLVNSGEQVPNSIVNANYSS
jgi:hypothetical protein